MKDRITKILKYICYVCVAIDVAFPFMNLIWIKNIETTVSGIVIVWAIGIWCCLIMEHLNIKNNEKEIIKNDAERKTIINER